MHDDGLARPSVGFNQDDFRARRFLVLVSYEIVFRYSVCNSSANIQLLLNRTKSACIAFVEFFRINVYCCGNVIHIHDVIFEGFQGRATNRSIGSEIFLNWMTTRRWPNASQRPRWTGNLGVQGSEELFKRALDERNLFRLPKPDFNIVNIRGDYKVSRSKGTEFIQFRKDSTNVRVLHAVPEEDERMFGTPFLQSIE